MNFIKISVNVFAQKCFLKVSVLIMCYVQLCHMPSTTIHFGQIFIFQNNTKTHSILCNLNILYNDRKKQINFNLYDSFLFFFSSDAKKKIQLFVVINEKLQRKSEITGKNWSFWKSMFRFILSKYMNCPSNKCKLLFFMFNISLEQWTDFILSFNLFSKAIYDFFLVEFFFSLPF